MPDSTDESRSQAGDRAEWWQALRRTVLRVLDALESADRGDPGFRQDLIRLLGAPPDHPADATPVAPPAPEPIDRPSPPPPRILTTPLPSPLIGPRIVVPAAPDYPARWTGASFEAPRIAERCRLKARATRWQNERSARLDAGDDVTDGDAQIRNLARNEKVFLWMISPTMWRERTPDSVEIVAGCYDALADAVELMALADQLEREQEPALKLLAEAQSSVRAAVEDYSSTRRDEDQETVFFWLRRETVNRRIYVEYMQLDRPAAPDNHPDLRQRIAALRRGLDESHDRSRKVEKLINKIGYHAGKIAHRSPDEPLPTGPDDGDFDRIAVAAEALLGAGIPPSDTRLREALLPIIDRFSTAEEEDRLPSALSRVVESIQDFLDQQEAEADRRAAEEVDDGSDPFADDPMITAARQRVAGRDAVLIGGIPSEPHRNRLQRGLTLRSLNWIRIEHHESFDNAEAAIRRPGVGVVFILTRWRSHRDGPAARRVCRELNIPLVESPGGYNLRQMAHRIVEQVPDDHPAEVAPLD